ncbi:ferredoxin [Vibrio sp. MACH09]|uniref:2Fe-2S iron-sulfur cluster-binding protein n=1 Tax=unclassified Vibrio TaxID=2614977 RepID=UPI001493D62D|nr:MULTISPECIES: 2Fe-2S iron-sulfur cluster binding domain-containing protein [unclassified Vibrio]NOI68195.1 2Fe-2S iron-sulfur cluster binding domain-containing protein [Vibrio sp. 99-8-1]GLO62314.1 ferredoxin [Vibrio sp. MACH09]
MNHIVTLYPQNIEFEVSEETTLLEAALNSNIKFPHRCHIGACSSCMCRLLEGNIEYQLQPMLTEKEQADGWMFPCLAYVKSNIKLTFEE